MSVVLTVYWTLRLVVVLVMTDGLENVVRSAVEHVPMVVDSSTQRARVSAKTIGLVLPALSVL
jgi:hypothetical protein